MLHTRRECIKDMLNSAGFVNVQELVNRFQVSSETIRRDLEYLEKEGVLKRIHGGAVGDILFTKANPFGSSDRRSFGHADQFHGQVAILRTGTFKCLRRSFVRHVVTPEN